MKKDLDDLMFDNTTLKKDLTASTALLKDTQEHLNQLMAKESLRAKQDQ